MNGDGCRLGGGRPQHLVGSRAAVHHRPAVIGRRAIGQPFSEPGLKRQHGLVSGRQPLGVRQGADVPGS